MGNALRVRTLGPLNNGPELANVAQLHQEVNRLDVLEVVKDANEERTVESKREIFLISNVLQLLLLLRLEDRGWVVVCGSGLVLVGG
jgi:hypothetical protein